VLTVDFITPVVDDPVAFGRIAAANALSDVWAMGGDPLLALNLAAFPREQLPLDDLAEILAAMAAVVHEAGALTVGGHSIDDPELKAGLSVVGRVHPDRVVRNSAGRPGDLLYLTKPLGVGIATTALKRGELGAAAERAVVAQMSALNRDAAAAMLAAGAVAATDVTGFGLLGHLGELALASGLAARVDSRAVPFLPGTRELALAGAVAGGTRRNLDAAAGSVAFSESHDETLRLMLADAQTSGGLLIAIAPERAAGLERELAARGLPVHRVGQLEQGIAGRVRVI
jgi:selenide,water dikinase